MRRGGKTQKCRCLLLHTVSQSPRSDTTVESGAMHADELLFSGLHRKMSNTQEKQYTVKTERERQNFLGANETLISISLYTYA